MDESSEVSSEQKPAGRFDPEVLDSTIIALPLMDILEDKPSDVHDVVIDVNLEYPKGRDQARRRVKELVTAVAGAKPDQGLDESKTGMSGQYLFARLDAQSIKDIVRRDRESGKSLRERAIFHVWPDFPVRPLITKSISTIKADAAHAAFSAFGKNQVWAVIDSGIDREHPHFQQHSNLELPDGLKPVDFTRGNGDPFDDSFGHGTHVAGIMAGESRADNVPIMTVRRYKDESGKIVTEEQPVERVTGIAPQCKILSLKVLDEKGDGLASNIIAALAYVQELNGYGRRLRVHGVNLSVGYQFEPEWFACGQSPLCVEVDLLVRSGVVVVVAAGNTGYGWQKASKGVVSAGLDLTINDPGNAERAITVGATHRDSPHIYGVSYFSSKGPTGDGRLKPDLIAPGERILSCAAGAKLDNKGKPGDGIFVEDSGTSMAAPHVSGAVAAFLSIRNEFIGRPDRVKEIFTSTAVDLKRERTFQGHGLVDLMRAIQSV